MRSLGDCYAIGMRPGGDPVATRWRPSRRPVGDGVCDDHSQDAHDDTCEHRGARKGR